MSDVSRAASKFGEFVGITGSPVFIKSDNIIDLIIHDHNQAKSLYATYKASQDLDFKQKTANDFIRGLVLHDKCEQLLVYPMLRERVGGETGEQQYERSLKEHQEHRELLYSVKNTNLKSNPQEFDEKLEKPWNLYFITLNKK